MTRRFVPSLLPVILLLFGCAGPTQLAKKSEKRMDQGDHWKAWALATRALDKAPANQEARAAATRAANSISQDWQRRIHALAGLDSSQAVDQVLEFAAFRSNAVRYVTVTTEPSWNLEETALREAAARRNYRTAVADLASNRPKRAYLHFMDADHYAPGYRDAAARADRVLPEARTTVAFVPLYASSGPRDLGRQVAASWRGDVVEHMTPPGCIFTEVLPVEEVERNLRASELGRTSRDEALRLGRRARADRVVWGTIGEVESRTTFSIFSDPVWRRVREKDATGNTTTHWVAVPIEVISRVRHVDVSLEYEVIATRTGATLARRHDPCSMSARVMWTAYTPIDDASSYALVTDELRQGDPERAKQVETRWKATVGEGTTLAQVFQAKRGSSRAQDPREVLGRFIAGAAFVMLEDLPSKEDIAFAALARNWRPVHRDLLAMDATDDVDLGVAAEVEHR